MHGEHTENGYNDRNHHNPSNFDAMIFAHKAVHKTIDLLSNGIGNRVDDILTTGGASNEQLQVARNLARTQAANPLQGVAQDAVAALRAKAGNCGECAAVAFALLHCWRVGPIAYCSSSTIDHAFVLIKLADDSDNFAVVVDPWARTVREGRVLDSGYSYFRTLQGTKSCYRNPDVVASVAQPTSCIISAAENTVESHDSMEGLVNYSNQQGAQQMTQQGWVWDRL